MRIDLKGKRAIVTGGNTGIGRAIALGLADHGSDVAITFYRNTTDETVQEIKAMGRHTLACKMDATNSSEVEEIVAEIGRFFDDQIDILVNNVGGLIDRINLREMEDQHWHEVISVNLDSAFYVTRAVLPFIRSGWGRIVNISSLAAYTGGGEGAIAYGAAKAGILGLTRGLAKELAPEGITANAVAPGLILGTPFHDTHTRQDAIDAVIAQTPLKVAGKPEDVAGAVLYLVSELANFVTGEVIEVNGGLRFS